MTPCCVTGQQMGRDAWRLLKLQPEHCSMGDTDTGRETAPAYTCAVTALHTCYSYNTAVTGLSYTVFVTK